MIAVKFTPESFTMILDNCWRCKGTPIPEAIGDWRKGEPQRYRVRCEGCGALSLASETGRMAAILWNDAQREERRILTDTELLQQPPERPPAGYVPPPPGAGDKLRDDTP